MTAGKGRGGVFENLHYGVRDGIATITIARPEVMNAIDLATGRELIAALDETDRDNDVRAVIITGAGDRAFCAGADLSGGADTFDYEGLGSDALGDREGGVVRDSGGLVTLRIFDSLKPVIGAVNGAAVGFGASILLAMDIRLGSTRSRYGYVYARRGIVPDAACSWFLPRVVGIPTAMEWVATGRIFDAQEALARGLIRSVHDPKDLIPSARMIAREIADNTAPVAAALTRQLMWRMLGAAHPMEAHRADSRAIQNRGASPDAREGVASFLEKRAPIFPCRLTDGLPDVFPEWIEPKFS